MQKQSSIAHRAGLMFVYLLIGVVATYLFSYLTQLYVELFGETYTPMTKLLASTVSLLACLSIVFCINHVSLKLNSKHLGISLALVIFTALYIIGPGIRAPITLYITSVSFPYNINMLAVILLPLVFGRVLYQRRI